MHFANKNVFIANLIVKLAINTNEFAVFLF